MVEAPGGGGSAEDSTSLDGAGVSGAGACGLARGADRKVSSGRSEPNRELDSHALNIVASAASIAPLARCPLACPNTIIPDTPFPKRANLPNFRTG